MASYTDEERAEAVAALIVAGYPDKVGSLTTVSNEFGIPHRTLSRWFRKQSNPPPGEIVAQKKEALSDRLESLIDQILLKLPAKLDEAPASTLLTGLGIAIDKYQLVRGEATSRDEVRGITIHTIVAEEPPVIIDHE